MKKQAMTMMTIILGSLGATSLHAYASEYTDATNASNQATITILENDSPTPDVPDPDDPDNPIIPVDPINPSTGELRINYVSAFDFGQLKNTSSAIAVNAKMDNVTLANGDTAQRVPFITTEDRRGTDRAGWELRVSQPTQLRDENNNELQGAEITLKGFHYAAQGTTTPEVNANALTLNSSEQVLASADATQGSGAWSLALGNASSDSTTDGVTLTVPANTVKNNVAYTAAITWELVADPAKVAE